MRKALWPAWGAPTGVKGDGGACHLSRSRKERWEWSKEQIGEEMQKRERQSQGDLPGPLCPHMSGDVVFACAQLDSFCVFVPAGLAHREPLTKKD